MSGCDAVARLGIRPWQSCVLVGIALLAPAPVLPRSTEEGNSIPDSGISLEAPGASITKPAPAQSPGPAGKPSASDGDTPAGHRSYWRPTVSPAAVAAYQRAEQPLVPRHVVYGMTAACDRSKIGDNAAVIRRVGAQGTSTARCRYGRAPARPIVFQNPFHQVLNNHGRLLRWTRRRFCIRMI